jgi:hypothetical protein
MPPRPRTPSPEEARLLTVYLDAERYLLETVRGEVRDVADLAQAGADVDARRVAGVRRVRQATESVVRGLERGAPARVEAIIGAAAEQGVDEAVRQLSAVTSDGGLADYGDTINRGALDRLAAATVALLTQAHVSILRTVDDAFREAVSRTVSGVLIGAQTRREAAQRALWSLADRGVTSFVDRAGRRWRLSSYVEMATRTAAARAHVDAQLDRLAAAGHEFVQVSDAPRECPLCAPWEGRVLVQSDGPTGRVEAQHALDDERTVVVDVAGTVTEARAAGLLHPNCRHSLSVYLPGVTPDMRAEEVRSDSAGYNAGQRQREIERHIRAWKSRAVAAVDDQGRRYAEQHVRAWQAHMRDHLRAHPDLKRLRYREEIGAGNLPTVGLRERLGSTGPTPQLVQSRKRTPRQMTDGELERRMRAALAGEDFDAFDALANESDRRDAARAEARERRAAEREQREQQQAEEFDRLLAQGEDEEAAVEAVYGVSVETQRRQRAIEQLRANGYTGRSFDELSRAAFRDYVWQQFSAAEEATNGYMLSREREAANARESARNGRTMDPLDLFTGPEHIARANASDELLAWWDEFGRPSLAEFRAELLGDGGAARAMRSSRGDFLA